MNRKISQAGQTEDRDRSSIYFREQNGLSNSVPGERGREGLRAAARDKLLCNSAFCISGHITTSLSASTHAIVRTGPHAYCCAGIACRMHAYIHMSASTGIWHTGIIVYGKEYFFGGGLQSMPHEQFVQMHGGVGPTEYIELGSTDIPQVRLCVCGRLLLLSLAFALPLPSAHTRRNLAACNTYCSNSGGHSQPVAASVKTPIFVFIISVVDFC